MNKYKCWIFALICLVNIGLAQNKVGTASAAFLNIPGGARSVGVGGAFAAIGDDAMSVFGNVAGISLMHRSEVSFNMADWFAGSNLNHWVGILTFGNHTFGLSMKQLDYGDEIVTTVAEPEGTGEKWSAQDQALGLSYATHLTDRFSIGGTFKYISEQIYHETAHSVAVDLGLLFISDYKNIRIGMYISNFGLDSQLDGKDLLQATDVDEVYSGNNENISAKLTTDEWPLPLLFCVGLGADIINHNWINWQIAVDALHPNNNDSYLRAGTEISFLNDLLFLRCGHSAIFKENAEEGFSFGAGLRYSVSQLKFGFDYSLTDFGCLGNIPQFGISLGL